MTTKSNTVAIVKTVKEQDKLFASLANDRRSLEQRMHQAAVSVLWHVGQHKDIRQVDKLFAVLEDSDGHTAILTNSLRAWFEAFGPVSFEDGKTKFVKDKPLQLAKATEVQFWKFKPQKAYQAVDVLGMLQSNIKKLIKDQQETGTDHAATIAALEGVIAAEKRRSEAKAGERVVAKSPLIAAPYGQPEPTIQAPAAVQ